ncbi:MAG: metallophosphoesterase [Candidatus Brockarchaeota archaeon]|nr:metallophosphoesterase [Candidatus Brockarchaeota archaeon]
MRADVSSVWEDPDKVREFGEEEVTNLLQESLEAFRDERNLLRIGRGKTLFVGDTHGNFSATKEAFRAFSSGGFDRIVFLGDYVDRGEEQLENANFVLSLRLAKPERVLLLRGNHETFSTNSRYGFRQAVAEKLPEGFFVLYNRAFSYLPLAAVTWDGIFAVHGGIAEGLDSIGQIDGLPRGELEPTSDLVLQLLWNDPSEEVDGFAFNDQRGGFCYYGQGALAKFMDANGLRMLLRSHEVFLEGFKRFFGGKLLSIFSSTGYCGLPIKGKVACLSSDGEVSLMGIEG